MNPSCMLSMIHTGPITILPYSVPAVVIGSHTPQSRIHACTVNLITISGK